MLNVPAGNGKSRIAATIAFIGAKTIFNKG